MAATRHQPRLQLLECGRGLAAFAVVLFHANVSSRMEGWRSYDWFGVFQYGVDFFFVLSGFIIYFAHARDFGRPHQVASYVKKRLIRLIPTLWVVTVATFLLQSMLEMPVDFAQLVRSAFPYPSLLPTDPAVVWTLRHEFLFYLLIGIAIWSRKLGFFLGAVWLCAASIQLVALSVGQGAGGIASFFLSTYAFQFFLGMGLAALHQRRTFAPSFAALAVGLILLLVALFWDAEHGTQRFGPADYIHAQASWFTLVLGCIFALIVHALVTLEGRLKAPRALVSLGAATYSVYLIHAPVNGLLMRGLRQYPDILSSGAGAVILVVLGTGAGIVLHHLFEAPTGRWLKLIWLDKKTPQTTSGGSDLSKAQSSSFQG